MHTGYAVAASTTRSSVAFCSVLVVSHRATWAVLPWTLVTLAWLLVYRQARPDTPKRGTGNLASGSTSSHNRLYDDGGNEGFRKLFQDNIETLSH